jgi:hypothetical protein
VLLPLLLPLLAVVVMVVLAQMVDPLQGGDQMGLQVQQRAPSELSDGLRHSTQSHV